MTAEERARKRERMLTQRANFPLLFAEFVEGFPIVFMKGFNPVTWENWLAHRQRRGKGART